MAEGGNPKTPLLELWSKCDCWKAFDCFILQNMHNVTEQTTRALLLPRLPVFDGQSALFTTVVGDVMASGRNHNQSTWAFKARP